jgi:hypothetical protein
MKKRQFEKISKGKEEIVEQLEKTLNGEISELSA